MFLLWREVPPKQKRLSLFEATYILLLRVLRDSSESYERVVKRSLSLSLLEATW
jgi:hypothetical protein